MTDPLECKNTDRELWRGPDEGNGDFYADSIFVTEDGSIGIDCGGYVIVQPLREWHKAASKASRLDAYEAGRWAAVETQEKARNIYNVAVAMLEELGEKL